MPTPSSVTVSTAALGGEIKVETVEGPVTLALPAGTQPGQVVRMKGHGLPVLGASRRGDHFVEVKVEVPTKLSRRERELWEELRDA